MDKNVVAIRKAQLVFHREGEQFAKNGHTRFPSISQAKHWSRTQPKGSVRRYESLERELGPKAVKELFK